MLGNSDKTMGSIKRSIEILALTRYDVSWSLTDLGTRCKIMSLKQVIGIYLGATNSNETHICSQYGSPLKMFQCIYGHDLAHVCRNGMMLAILAHMFLTALLLEQSCIDYVDKRTDAMMEGFVSLRLHNSKVCSIK